MKIGELAKKTGCPVETIRFYELQGLLDRVARTGSNYRVYSEGHVERLGFIMHCRRLDMALDEIREILKLDDEPGESCVEVKPILDSHIGHVSERIRELRQLERQLRRLRAHCQSVNSTKDCGILTELWKKIPAAGKVEAVPLIHVQGAHRGPAVGSNTKRTSS